MRRAVLAALLLAGCATPVGAPVPECDASWRVVDSLILEGESGGEPMTVPIDCIRRAALRRIRVGFTMPPGPDCFTLRSIEVVESGDAVSVSLVVARRDDPFAVACPEQGQRAATEIELQAPVEERALLDGSRQGQVPAATATMAP